MVTSLRILIVVALQTAALAYMIVDRQAMLNASRVVTLKVAPVDPRDIFRGDYVILSYDITRLEPGKLEGDDVFAHGEKVYVTLVPSGDTWTAAAIAHNKPVAMPNGVAILGTVDSYQLEMVTAPATEPPTIGPDGQPPSNQVAGSRAQSVTISYGIESWFVPEGTGREIENERQKGDLSADIAIDNTGRAAIKALRRSGKVFYVEGIF
jgi:uncharacterized membrane-anchored protein